MCSLHQQTTQQPVSFFADTQLRLTAARVSPLGLQADEGSCIPATLKPFRILERENKCQSDQRSHSVDLLEQNYFVAVFALQLFYLLIIDRNLFAQLLHAFQHWSEQLAQLLAKLVGQCFVYLLAVAA